MIITGGVNVYPQEIEIFWSRIRVADAAVIGVPEDLGEAVTAVVQARSGRRRPEFADELRRWMRQSLSSVKTLSIAVPPRAAGGCPPARWPHVLRRDIAEEFARQAR